VEAILVDTSVWINFFKNIPAPSNDFLDSNFTSVIITTCPVILQEIFQGIAIDADEKALKPYFENLVRLTDDPYIIAFEAAGLYRSLRKRGITIRKPNDCLIAAYAIRNDIELLHNDRDFTNIAAFSDLKTVAI